MSTTANNNYAPPRSRVEDPIAATPVEFEPATRGSRLGASILDTLIMGGPMFVIIIASLSRVGVTRGPNTFFSVWSSVLAHPGPGLYAGGAIELALIGVTTALVYRNGQTIGKKLCGIKVACLDGSRATLPRIFFLRYFPAAISSFIPVMKYVFVLPDPLFIFGQDRRCIHDYIAGTIVIRA
jgi:uncharacterized RDD family membrane protein YckC